MAPFHVRRTQLPVEHDAVQSFQLGTVPGPLPSAISWSHRTRGLLKIFPWQSPEADLDLLGFTEFVSDRPPIRPQTHVQKGKEVIDVGDS